MFADFLFFLHSTESHVLLRLHDMTWSPPSFEDIVKGFKPLNRLLQISQGVFPNNMKAGLLMPLRKSPRVMSEL